jgi:hypothetical protein
MTRIFFKGNGQVEVLDDIEMLRYRLVMQNVTEVMLDIYTQTAMTDFSPETWATQGVTLVERVLGNDGGKLFWSGFAHNYPSSFRAEVDRVLDGLAERS